MPRTYEIDRAVKGFANDKRNRDAQVSFMSPRTLSRTSIGTPRLERHSDLPEDLEKVVGVPPRCPSGGRLGPHANVRTILEEVSTRKSWGSQRRD